MMIDLELLVGLEFTNNELEFINDNYTYKIIGFNDKLILKRRSKKNPFTYPVDRFIKSFNQKQYKLIPESEIIYQSRLRSKKMKNIIKRIK